MQLEDSRVQEEGGSGAPEAGEGAGGAPFGGGSEDGAGALLPAVAAGVVRERRGTGGAVSRRSQTRGPCGTCAPVVVARRSASHTQLAHTRPDFVRRRLARSEGPSSFSAPAQRSSTANRGQSHAAHNCADTISRLFSENICCAAAIRERAQCSGHGVGCYRMEF